MSAYRPCGNCVRGEYADDDSDGLNYVAAPDSNTAHIQRPSGSWGTGGAFQAMAWMNRGREPYTYCGRPIGSDWVEAPPL